MKAHKPKIATEKTLRNNCDQLLTPIIKKMHPYCLLHSPGCHGITEVAHHHVHKSKSTRLRYEIDNLIPLCHHCHVVLHNNESRWASHIVSIKGIEWWKNLEKKGQETVKADRLFYQRHLERLQDILSREDTPSQGSPAL